MMDGPVFLKLDLPVANLVGLLLVILKPMRREKVGPFLNNVIVPVRELHTLNHVDTFAMQETDAVKQGAKYFSCKVNVVIQPLFDGVKLQTNFFLHKFSNKC